MDIHNNLKETVANGYLSRSYNGGRNYALWKNYFRRNFCNLPIHEDCNATRDLAYLERKGHIKIGDYDVLIDIFRKIDERAIQYIEKKTSDIKAVGKGRCDVVIACADPENFPLFSVTFLRELKRFEFSGWRGRGSEPPPPPSPDTILDPRMQ